VIDRYVLLGEHVERSLSPVMMNAAFACLGIPAEYSAISVARESFAQSFQSVRDRARGMNITIPFKSAVVPLVDRLDDGPSLRLRAINVIKRSGREFLGYNTDYLGILRPLEEEGFPAKGSRVLLLGAGGAARAFCEAMNQLRCGTIIVSVRDVQRGRAFLADVSSVFPAIDFELRTMDDATFPAVELVFNATPIGTEGTSLPPSLKRFFYRGQIVFDAVYRPMQTELLRAASQSGCVIIHGYRMLLHQGVGALEIWTNTKAPVAVMETALLRSLRGGDPGN
jgi:shikimate dehydrogenase